MDVEILQVLSIVALALGVMWRLYMPLMAKLGKQDEILANILAELSAIKAGMVGYVTRDQCLITNEKIETRLTNRIENLK